MTGTSITSTTTCLILTCPLLMKSSAKSRRTIRSRVPSCRCGPSKSQLQSHRSLKRMKIKRVQKARRSFTSQNHDLRLEAWRLWDGYYEGLALWSVQSLLYISLIGNKYSQFHDTLYFERARILSLRCGDKTYIATAEVGFGIIARGRGVIGELSQSLASTIVNRWRRSFLRTHTSHWLYSASRSNFSNPSILPLGSKFRDSSSLWANITCYILYLPSFGILHKGLSLSTCRFQPISRIYIQRYQG